MCPYMPCPVSGLSVNAFEIPGCQAPVAIGVHSHCYPATSNCWPLEGPFEPPGELLPHPPFPQALGQNQVPPMSWGADIGIAGGSETAVGPSHSLCFARVSQLTGETQAQRERHQTMPCGLKENHGGSGRVNLRSKGAAEATEMGGGSGHPPPLGPSERSTTGPRGGPQSGAQAGLERPGH